MKFPAQDLEPVPRDPKKLRMTAGILVGIAVLSGIFIPIAYKRLTERQTDENRAPYLTRLEKNFAVVRQDGSTAGLLDMVGHVWLIAPFSVDQAETSARVLEVMQRMDERFADRDDLNFVLLTVDPEREPVERLADFAAEREMSLPRWWVAAAGPEYTHDFLKDQLLYRMLPHRGGDGEWIYDTSIKLISRERHVRGSFDFDGAAETDERLVAEGKEPAYVEGLEEMLYQRIVELLEEEPKS